MNEINYETFILEILKDYIINVKKKDLDVKLESNLINDLGIDSLDIIEIGFLIEEKFKIKVPIDLLMSITVNNVSDLVEFFKKNKC